MRVALLKVMDCTGSLLLTETLKILDVETIPEDMDELLEDFEADFYEVLDD